MAEVKLARRKHKYYSKSIEDWVQEHCAVKDNNKMQQLNEMHDDDTSSVDTDTGAFTYVFVYYVECFLDMFLILCLTVCLGICLVINLTVILSIILTIHSC